MSGSVPDDVVDELRSYIEIAVRAGFQSLPEIVESAVEVVSNEDTAPETLRPIASQLAADARAALVTEAEGWPPLTDCDRLDAAFAQLEHAGVMAHQDFACCQPCGHGEAWDLATEASNDGRTVRGYTFFHQQDTESVVESSSLYLAFAATAPGAEAEVAIGHEVVEALRTQGLQVVWDGTTNRRISVSMEWRKRPRP